MPDYLSALTAQEVAAWYRRLAEKVSERKINGQEPLSGGDRSFRVYHKNAKRVEEAKLASPYKLRSYIWQITNPGIIGPAEIDPSKKLN